MAGIVGKTAVALLLWVAVSSFLPNLGKSTRWLIAMIVDTQACCTFKSTEGTQVDVCFLDEVY